MTLIFRLKFDNRYDTRDLHFLFILPVVSYLMYDFHYKFTFYMTQKKQKKKEKISGATERKSKSEERERVSGNNER